MERLKERRVALGWSQQRMATACGVAYNTYRMWEYGMKMKPENEDRVEAVLLNAELTKALCPWEACE